MAQSVKRAYKYRFYPTPEQAAELTRTFGCVRLVYNKALEERSRAYTAEGRKVSYAQTSTLLTAWKKTPELAFLSEVSSVPLQQALRHLQTGFVNFFAKRAGYPAFKSRKKSRRSAEYTRSAFRWRDGTLTLAKMDGPLRIRKLARAQQALARKEWGSKNRAKARLRVARVHARITDRRRDFLHKLTTRLVRENQTVVIEDLTVGNLLRNHALARAISDASWRAMRGMLEYKTAWYGRELVVVDRWFPSSKLCSGCGVRQEVMPLNLRSW
ncbi:MAG: RNA-guided endonuclease TnpB family protein, partial [Spirillospora sp.]